MSESMQPAGPPPRGESDFPFSVTVGAVYDGPLDLLLDLIRRQDIDIYDIPIAQITAQYLAYIENMKGLDVNLPQVAKAPDLAVQKEPLVVTVQRGGGIGVGDETVASLEKLGAVLQPAEKITITTSTSVAAERPW